MRQIDLEGFLFIPTPTLHRGLHFQNAFYGCERGGTGLSGIGRVEQQADHGAVEQRRSSATSILRRNYRMLKRRQSEAHLVQGGGSEM